MINIGDKVRAVRGPKRTINPDPQYIGQIGVVQYKMGVLAGMAHYRVAFDRGDDCIDECNLEVCNERAYT